MQIGYIGLGKMGKNMVLRLLEKGHEVVAWNRSPEPREEVAKAGAIAVETLEEMVQKLPAPRVVWLMLPGKQVTDEMIEKMAALLEPGDTVIDGGNNHFKEAAKHKSILSTKSVHFIDAGVSGGPAGARNGACIMVGGDEEMFSAVEPIIKDASAPDAYRFFPGAGAGHFVKMVHNGIEYGMMQALGEGFEIMKKSEYNLDLLKVAEIYNKGSVIESRLVGWLISAFQKHGQELQGISGSVGMLGEGQWTVDTAKEMNIPVPILEGSVQFRLDSVEHPSYNGKVLSALRSEFGGHIVTEGGKIDTSPK